MKLRSLLKQANLGVQPPTPSKSLMMISLKEMMKMTFMIQMRNPSNIPHATRPRQPQVMRPAIQDTNEVNKLNILRLLLMDNLKKQWLLR